MTSTTTLSAASNGIAAAGLHGLLGGLAAGAIAGAWVGVLAVRVNPSLQGPEQVGSALLLAAGAYAAVLAVAGVAVALIALAIRRRAVTANPGFLAGIVAPLSGMLAFIAAQTVVRAVLPWRDEDDPLNLGCALGLALIVAVAVAALLPRAAGIAKLLWGAIVVAVLATLVFGAVTLRQNGALPVFELAELEMPPSTVSVSATPRVMLIGVDGADWARLTPLIEAGRLPNFARLCKGAYSAPLATTEPTWSPVVWNTIATGVREDRHGVLDFTEVQLPMLEKGVQRAYPKYKSAALLPYGVGLVPALRWMLQRELLAELPVTALQRRRKAFWEILAEHGVQVGVVRWWASWPAAELDGYLVSDNDPMAQVLAATKARNVSAHATMSHMTWPPELVNELVPLIDADGPFAAAAANPLEQRLAHPVLGELTEGERAELRDQPHVLEQFELIVRGDQFATRAGLHLWNVKAVPMLAVYLRAVDNISHRFWRRTGVVDRTYEFTDRLVGELLDAGGDSTTYVLVSDHGWSYVPGPTFGHGHGPSGVVIVRGPEVQAHPAPELEPTVLDIAPTLLALYGLPPETGFDGRPLNQLFAAGATAAEARTPIESYGEYQPVWPSLHGSSLQAGQRQAVDLLRGLGYLGD